MVLTEETRLALASVPTDKQGFVTNLLLFVDGDERPAVARFMAAVIQRGVEEQLRDRWGSIGLSEAMGYPDARRQTASIIGVEWIELPLLTTRPQFVEIRQGD